MKPVISPTITAIAERFGSLLGEGSTRSTQALSATIVDDLMHSSASEFRSARRMLDPVLETLTAPNAEQFVFGTGFDRWQVQQGVQSLEAIARAGDARDVGNVSSVAIDALNDARKAASGYRESWSVDNLAEVAPTMAHLDAAIARLTAAGF